MKRMTLPFTVAAVALGVLLSTGCRSSLKVPFVDLSMGTPGHSHSHHSHKSKSGKLEDKIEALEDENRELKERLEALEQSSN